MNSRTKITLRSLLAIALAAGGMASIIGSGGGGGGSSSVPMVEITEDNAQDVASVVIQSVDATFELGSVTGGQVTSASAAPTAGASALRHVLPRLSRARSLGLDVRPLAAFGPETLDCDVSGTVTVSGDLADPDTLSAGDRITASFNDCRDEEPFVLDGRLEIVVRAIQGDFLTDVYLLTLDLTLTNLNVTDGTENFTGDGDVTLTLDSLDFPVTLSRIAGSVLELGSGQDVYTLTDFSHTLEVDATNIPEEYTAEAFGSVASNLLGGMVDYDTVAPILASGEDDPDTGEILVTGADRTTVSIVIVDSANVRLDIDTDGDGSVDVSQDTNWAALNGDNSTINSSTAPVLTSEALAAVADFGGAASVVGGQFCVQCGSPFRQIAQQAISGNFGPVALGCQASGTATVSGSIAVAGTYSPGDQLNATYASCDSISEVMTGQMDVTVGTFTGGGTGAFLFSGTAAFTNVQLVFPDNDPFAISTNLSTTFDATNLPGIAGYITANSSASTAVIQAGTVTRTLSGAVAETTVVFSSPVRITYAPSGTLATSLLSGSVDYESIQPFIIDSDSNQATGPFSGEMLITASDGSSVRLVIVDNLNVRLDIDLDGDDFVDERLERTWLELN